MTTTLRLLCIPPRVPDCEVVGVKAIKKVAPARKIEGSPEVSATRVIRAAVADCSGSGLRGLSEDHVGDTQSGGRDG
jgi:hypothetical protein